MFSIQQDKEIFQVKFNNNDDYEIITGTGEILQDTKYNSTKAKNWQEYKANSLKIAELIEQSPILILDNVKLERLKHCADTLLFANLEDGSKRLRQAYFCKNRICPMCQWRRSLKMYNNVDEITREMLKQEPKTRFIFLTLTIRNCKKENLVDSINLLNNAFTTLIKPPRRKAPIILKKFVDNSYLGYYKALEITYSRMNKDYHPHLHCIIAVKPNYFGYYYISYAKWQECWKFALNENSKEEIDYYPEIDIKAIKTNFSNDKLQHKTIAEVAKYPLKSVSILKIKNKAEAISVLDTFIKVLYNRKFISMGGAFYRIQRQLSKEDIEGDNTDLVHIGNDVDKALNIVSYTMYKYDKKFGLYIC